ncbi:MAG: hypothetical protein CSYNP_03536 [Syntrophus sp. SKADARSKE-3]|nr:hypothetical protein [Syntrophus sp. SKADARSKE-3]
MKTQDALHQPDQSSCEIPLEAYADDARIAEGNETSATETFQAQLKLLVDLDTERKRLEKASKEIGERLKVLKDSCLEQFAIMSLKSVKAHKKTIYIQQQLWAGIGEDTDVPDLIDELRSLNLGQYAGVGTQAISGYIREHAFSNPEFLNEEGEIIADPEQILATLPSRLPQLLKITNKIDIKIRK